MQGLAAVAGVSAGDFLMVRAGIREGRLEGEEEMQAAPLTDCAQSDPA